MARLGYQRNDRQVPDLFPGARLCVPRGIVIPWLNGEFVDAVKVHRPMGQPKLITVEGSRRNRIYPNRTAIMTGKPLVIAACEIDALLLGQELGEFAPVVTFDCGNGRPSSRALSAMLRAFPWVIAHGADDEDKRSVGDWLALSDRSVRVLPPGGKRQDWSEVYRSGLDLRGFFHSALETVVSEPVQLQATATKTDLLSDNADEGTEESPRPNPIGPVGTPNRWRCLNPYCLHKSRWWMSAYGVVLCANCQPPGLPSLVIAEGDTSTAPLVEPGRSQQAVDYPRPVPADTLIPSSGSPG